MNEKVSGNLIKHYQPKASVHSIKTSEIGNLTEEPLEAKSVLLLLSDINIDNIQTYTMPRDPYKYGQILYSTLRLMDDRHFEKIIIELPPEKSDWYAIHDRIKKASFKKL